GTVDSGDFPQPQAIQVVFRRTVAVALQISLVHHAAVVDVDVPPEDELDELDKAVSVGFIDAPDAEALQQGEQVLHVPLLQLVLDDLVAERVEGARVADGLEGDLLLLAERSDESEEALLHGYADQVEDGSIECGHQEDESLPQHVQAGVRSRDAGEQPDL